MKLDEQPDGEGVPHPNATNYLIIPKSATCQETLGMVNNRYMRCAAPAIAVVQYPHRGEPLYWMCREHADHACRNRGGHLLAVKPDSDGFYLMQRYGLKEIE